MGSSVRRGKTSDNFCIQKSKYVSKTTANSQSRSTKASPPKHHVNLSKIYAAIATHENEPSSQLEAENGDNAEEDFDYDVTHLVNQAMCQTW